MRDLLLFAFVAFVACATPGAGVLFTVTSALRLGRGAFMAAPLGNFSGIVIVSVISAAGMGAVITATPVLFYGLQAICSLTLVWFGWKNWKAPALDIASVGSSKAVRTSHNGLSAYLGALLLQTTNPMLFVFLLSLMPPFVRPDEDYASQMATLIAIFSLTGLTVHLTYGFIAAFASSYLKGKRFSLIINRVSAVLFWLLAAGVIISLF